MELLSIKGLNLTIGNDKKIINSSFSVFPGDVVLLTGQNGSGKSTLIKILMCATFEYDNLDYSAETVLYKGKYNIIGSDQDNELFRRNVCYVSQEDEFESDSVLDCFINSIDYSIQNEKEKYVYDFIKRFSIYDCFEINDSTLKLDHKSKRIIREIGIDQSQISAEDKKIVRFLALNTKKMSGGQKKLINIFSNLVRYGFCDLIILDEPLNNLDYNNVRAFSNVLTRIYKSKPNLAVLIVTHCRSIPIVNRVISINTDKKSFVEESNYICNSCFGKFDDSGLYL